MRLSKKALVIGLAALMPMTATQADVLATSVVNMTNLVMLGSTDGGTTFAQLDYDTDLVGVSYTGTADQDASLGGTTVSETDTTSGGSTIDFAPSCVGECPVIADNAFPILSSAFGGPTQNYAASDQLEDGSPVLNLPDYDDYSADVANASYVGLDTWQTETSANSNNNLNATWEFTAEEATILAFQFDIAAYLEAYVSGDEVAPSFATAGFEVAFEISRYEPVYDNQGNIIAYSLVQLEVLAPPQLTQTVSVNAPTPGGLDAIALCTGCGYGVALTANNVVLATAPLDAGYSYQLSARINTNADAEHVPEPGVLALLGIGLLGIMGAARLRRRKVIAA